MIIIRKSPSKFLDFENINNPAHVTSLQSICCLNTQRMGAHEYWHVVLLPSWIRGHLKKAFARIG